MLSGLTDDQMEVSVEEWENVEISGCIFARMEKKKSV